MKKALKYLLASALILSVFSTQKSHSVSRVDFFDCKIESFPEAEANLFVFNEQDEPIYNFAKQDISVYDGGLQTEIKSLVKPNEIEGEPVSLIIAFDLGIVSYDEENEVFEKGRQLARQIINSFYYSKGECALTSFDQFSYINAEFGSNRESTIAALDKLRPSKSSNYSAGLISYPTGALAISARAKYEKAIVLISDGKRTEIGREIIDSARKYNATFYCLTINGRTQKAFKDACDSTGGKWFDKITTDKEIKSTALTLNAFAAGFTPAKVSWLPIVNCETYHKTKITVKDSLVFDEENLLFPDKYKPHLKIEPKSIAFSAVLAGYTKQESVKLTAMNKDITIDEFILNNPSLSIVEGGITAQNPQITIQKGDSHTVKIEFAPEDSSLIFDSLSIVSDACYGRRVLISGGFPNTPPQERNLTLTNPRCGDIIIAGDTVDVQWNGLLPNDVIQLEYSLNKGQSWDALAKDVNGLNYKWLAPKIETDELMIRAIQLWPNNVGQTMDFWHNGAVLSANFNEMGDLVVSSSADNTARVWNSNNGYELHELIGHTSPVRWANFNSDGKKVVTASDDSAAIIWDVSDHNKKMSEPIAVLDGHNDKVKSANFSPDDRYIVTTSWDGKAKLWNAADGKFVKNIYEDRSRLWFAQFSPDGKFLLLCSSANSIIVWDFENDSLYRDLRFINGLIMHADFSPDGERIVSAGWFGNAVMWDVESGDTLFTVAHPTEEGGIKPINSASFNRAGDLFMTTSVDNSAIIWDAQTGEKVKILREHRSAVNFASFNFDGMRILTASSDSTAKIWNLEKRDLQMDTTDCTLAIREPIVNAFDVSLGKTIVGETRHFKIDSFLINYSDFPIEVKNIKIVGSSDFTIINDSLPCSLDSFKIKDLEIAFTPSETGLIEGRIEISVSGLKITKKIAGQGYDTELQSYANYVDFGKVELGDYKDTVFTAIVKNVSEKRLKIESIELLGPHKEPFYVISDDESVELAPGEDLTTTLRFMPREIARKMARLAFRFNGGEDICMIPLYGEGVHPIIDSVLISIESATAKSGEVIEVPIKASCLNKDHIKRPVEGFRFDLTFNATMLKPLDNSFETKVIGDDKIMSIYLPRGDKENDITKTLKFYTALGNDSVSGLKISNPETVGEGKIAVDLKSGVFTLANYCNEGGPRLFGSDGKIELSRNIPNPCENATKIEIQTIEDGLTNLFVVDISGRVVKEVFSGSLKAGKYSFKVSTPDLSNGTYFYILQTPTRRIGRRMEVRR